MGMVYQWKPGSVHRIDPQAAGEEMERIRVRQNGRLEAVDVVRESRDPEAPLHDEFEWDDAKAADAHRVTQAMAMIRHITVLTPKRSGEDAPIRAFVSVVRDTDRSYTSTAHALSDAELRQQVLDQAWRELEAWRNRHAELTELAEIFATIDQARAA
ncbi:hypothetical protein [Sphingopyxis indica]|uniref:Uncharacterized protein n=1 Tax=Sphingopyxis indica TaxID=436663 RepID=A0A239KP19_9SPHN|nr:hypothetical protein [Sphingopyxis indica]SNT19418.1 hypothetical protein SAMN06295955_11553 [Sphingopyxis indica]